MVLSSGSSKESGLALQGFAVVQAPFLQGIRLKNPSMSFVKAPYCEFLAKVLDKVILCHFRVAGKASQFKVQEWGP